MPGVSGFLKSLPEVRWDSVLSVMHDLQDSTSHERIESLRHFLNTLTREIDQINRKRDALGHKVANIDALIPPLETYLKTNSDDLEVELFKNILLGWRANLKTEISELRPNGKLEKKYDTEKKRELLIQLQSLVSKLTNQMKSVQNESANGLHPEPKESVRK